MTEEEARRWIAERFGDDAYALVARFLDMVVAENAHQNLIAPSTVEHIWARHAVDSAQLIALAPAAGSWVDIGTGGGFPGMIVAILRGGETVLVEPRRRRAEFLIQSAALLGLNVRVCAVRVEAVRTKAAIMSARAVASVDKLLLAAGHCAASDTRWLLPRGQIAEGELADLQRRWAGTFHVEHSVTDPASSILVLDRVCRR